MGFGGTKKYENNEVILYSCDELLDYEIIKFENKNIKWKTFKENNFPNWTFETSEKENSQ